MVTMYYIPLLFYFAKSTLSVPLTFLTKSSKPNMESLILLIFFVSSSSCITQNYAVCVNFMHTKPLLC